MPKKKTNEEFVKEVFDLVGDEYIFLEEYAGAMKKILCKHNICKHEWLIKPNNFLSGYRCPMCAIEKVAKKKRKSNQQFLQEVFNLVGYEYKVMGIYKNNNIKIMMRHETCGFEWSVNPKAFLKGSRCPKCANKNTIKKTNKEFIDEVFNLVGSEYRFLEEYKNVRTKLLCQHMKCGHKWCVAPKGFLYNNNRCPNCTKKNKLKTNKQFVTEVFNLVEDEYIFLEKYKGANTKIKCKHNKCGHVWDITPASFLNSTRCPKCASSKGEGRIAEWLDNNNVKYIQEYRFNDCRYKNPLPFDFYIPKYNLLIEYDGIQHFNPTNFGSFSDEQLELEFKNTQQRDKIKIKYCKQNKIPLLVIPYWDFDNIEDILNNKHNKRW